MTQTEKQNMEHLRRVYKRSDDDIKQALDYLGASRVLQTWQRLKKLSCPAVKIMLQSKGE